MKFYRVVDYDFPPPHIVIRDFIDFNDAGIIIENEGEYSGGDLREADFDENKVKLLNNKEDLYIFLGDSYLDKFNPNLYVWWNEPMQAKKIKLDKLDYITLGTMKQHKSELFKGIFRGN
jgi:hypothetical protein